VLRLLALVFLVVVPIDGEDNVPGSDEVDVPVVTASAEVEAACSLVGSAKRTGSRNLLPACLITRDSRISTW
jgi:hypothetical protein